MFKTQVVALLPRLKKVGPVDFSEAAQSQDLKPIESKTIDLPPPPVKLVNSVPNNALLIEAIEKFVRPPVEGLQDSEKIAKLENQAALGIVGSIFDKIYVSIFGSQIATLIALNSGFMPRSIIEERFFNAAVNANAEAYKAASFDKWIGFLSSHNLIVVKENDVSISPLGRAFLTFVINEGYQVAKPL
jgi:hypothetical protein